MFYRHDEPIDVIFKDLLKAFDASLDCIYKDWETVDIPLVTEELSDDNIILKQVSFILESIDNLLETAFVTNDKIVNNFTRALRYTYKSKGLPLAEMIALDPAGFKVTYGRIIDEILFFAFLFFKAWLYQLDDENAYEILIIICDQFLAYSFKFNERAMDIQMTRESNRRLYDLFKELRDSYQHKLFLNLNRQTVHKKGGIPHRIIENKVQNIRFNSLRGIWDGNRTDLYYGLINKLKENDYIIGEHYLMRAINRLVPIYKWTEIKGGVKLNALVTVLLEEKLINGAGDELKTAFMNTFINDYKDIDFFYYPKRRVPKSNDQYKKIAAILIDLQSEDRK